MQVQSATKEFAMVAGEASGDLLASLLIDALRARRPDLRITGIGGPHMRERGFDAMWPSEKLAVRGYIEVLPHLRELLAIRRELGDRLLARRPDVFIGIDAPDFNFGIEERLKVAGIPTVHFVSPSFWAWRAKKVEKLKRSADHVLCIFPFEPELLAQHGVSASYVGHPLASVIPMEPDKLGARHRLGLPERGDIVAVLPGSRNSEIQQLAARFFAAARLMRQKRPGLLFAVPAVPYLQEQITRIAQSAGLGDRVRIFKGEPHDVLAACDAALVASGTATLETALFKRPMVIAYHMNWISWLMMRGKQLQPWVGLPNILCREFVVPELIQHKATPQALADGVSRWLDLRASAPETIAALEQRFTELHKTLRRDTVSLASDAIEKILAR
jgi:lipid-A-disaccharide synthase